MNSDSITPSLLHITVPLHLKHIPHHLFDYNPQRCYHESGILLVSLAFFLQLYIMLFVSLHTASQICIISCNFMPCIIKHASSIQFIHFYPSHTHRVWQAYIMLASSTVVQSRALPDFPQPCPHTDLLYSCANPSNSYTGYIAGKLE